MKDLEFLKELSADELLTIDGGGLVEDIGYACHAVEDGACRAYNWTKEKLSDAYDTVVGWFE